MCSNPCIVHVVNETGWAIEVFGDVFTVCNMEFDMEVNENGRKETPDLHFTAHWILEPVDQGTLELAPHMTSPRVVMRYLTTTPPTSD